MMDYGHNQAEKALKGLERRMQTEYRMAYDELSVKLEKHLERYELQDAAKRKLYQAGKITKEEYVSWRTQTMFVGKKWQAMRNSMARELVKLDAANMDIINNTAIGVFTDNANYGVYEVEAGFGLATDFALYNKDTAKVLFNDAGLHKSVNIRKDFRWNNKQISSALLQGVLQGESISGISKRLERVTEMDCNSAIRNARTMITGAENAGRLRGYKDMQDRGLYVNKVWEATLSAKTRDSHRAIDMESVPVDETFNNGLMYPGDPSGDPAEYYNCRCTMIAQTDHATTEALERWSDLPDDITYEEWKDGR